MREWFRLHQWEPFPFQGQVWAAYLRGESVLIHAATGTGKTYAAWMGPVLEWLRDYPESARRREQAAPLRVLWITPLRALAGECLTPPVYEAPFVFQYHPSESDAGYTLAGHLHPGLTLAGPALLRERLSCFVVGPRLAVLPAFGSFTGHCAIEPAAGEQIYLVAGDEVLPMRPGLVRPAGL